MAITLTQSKAWNVQTTGTTNAPVFTSVVTSGGCVTVYIAYDSTATISTVADDKGNTYAVKNTITETADAIKVSQAVRGNITNAPKTITVTFTGTIANSAVSIAEWAGISAVTDPSDVFGGQMQSAAANPTSGNITTTVDGDLISGMAVNGSTNVAYTAGSGFTIGLTSNTFFTSTSFLAWEWLIQSTHGVTASTWVDATATNYAVEVLSLKAATGAALTIVPYTQWPMAVRPPLALQAITQFYGKPPPPTVVPVFEQTDWGMPYQRPLPLQQPQWLIPNLVQSGVPGTVVFDAQTSPTIAVAGGTSFSDTNLTIGASANALIVLLSTGGDSSTPTVTWNGVALTLLVQTVSTGVNGYAGIFGMINPATGNHTLAGSWTNSNDAFIVGVSFSGVNTTSLAAAFPNTGSNTGTSTTMSVTTASSVGDIVAGVEGAPFQSSTPPVPDNINIFNRVSAGGFGGSANRAAGAASVTLSSTLFSSRAWAASGVDIKAANVAPALYFGAIYPSIIAPLDPGISPVEQMAAVFWSEIPSLQVTYFGSTYPNIIYPLDPGIYPTEQMSAVFWSELPSLQVTYFGAIYPNTIAPLDPGIYPTEQISAVFDTELPSLVVTYFSGSYPDFARGASYAQQQPPRVLFTPPSTVVTFFAGSYPDFARPAQGLPTPDQLSSVFWSELPSLQVTYFAGSYPDFARPSVSLPAPQQLPFTYTAAFPSFPVTYFGAIYPDFAKGAPFAQQQPPRLQFTPPFTGVTFFAGSYPDFARPAQGLPAPEQLPSVFWSELPSLQVTYFGAVYPDFTRPAQGLAASQQLSFTGSFLSSLPVTYFGAFYPDFARSLLGLPVPSQMSAIFDTYLPSLQVTYFGAVYPDITYSGRGLGSQYQQPLQFIRFTPVAVIVTYFAADYPDFARPKVGLPSPEQYVTDFKLPIIKPPVPAILPSPLSEPVRYKVSLHVSMNPAFIATEKNIPQPVLNRQLYIQGNVTITSPNIWKGRS